MNKIIILLIGFTMLSFCGFAQYDARYVETSSTTMDREKYYIIKMSRKDERVKVKYFAGKDYNGTSVYKRFNEWSRNKNIIAYSSGTYMDFCDPSIATPVGICLDNGNPVNTVIKDNLDGLAIVYATGGMVATNLKNGDLTITNSDKTSKKIDLRNAFQRAEFFKWAKESEATVFQTHLFCFKNDLMVFSNGSTIKQPRRFLAVGYQSGVIKHIILNIPGNNTVYDASIKAVKFLKMEENIDNISFLINLDTGCQNVFQTRNADGTVDIRAGFNGAEPLSTATNLIVYYYE